MILTYREEPDGIYQFQGPFRWLSNFHEAPVIFDGVEYPTTEHAFQAAKSLHQPTRVRIAQASTPGKAKRMGSPTGIIAPEHFRPDWEEVCNDVMMQVNWQKYLRHPHLGAALRATGGGTLVEGNAWGDDRWGALWIPAQQVWRGQNRLGRILMTIRSALP